MDELKVKAICEDYANRNIGTREICEKHGITGHTLTRVIIDNGLTPRRPGRIGEKHGKQSGRKCPKCRKMIDIKGARYCPFCAADMRTESELLIERQNKLFSIVQLLPTNARDEVQETILKTIEYLKKQG